MSSNLKYNMDTRREENYYLKSISAGRSGTGSGDDIEEDIDTKKIISKLLGKNKKFNEEDDDDDDDEEAEDDASTNISLNTTDLNGMSISDSIDSFNSRSSVDSCRPMSASNFGSKSIFSREEDFGSRITGKDNFDKNSM